MQMEHEFNQIYSDSISMIVKRYYEQRNKMIKQAQDKLKSNAKDHLYGIKGKLDTLLREAQNAADAELSSKLAQIETIFNRNAEKLAENFVNAVSVSEKRTFMQTINGASESVTKDTINSIDLLADQGIKRIINKSIGENVKLIQSIPQQHYQRIAKTIHDGLEKGQSYSTMAKEIRQINGVSERKAKFIARDQTASVYGELTQKRNENLGIEKFKWITSRDNRVRETHRVLDGMVFDWASGAKGPGVPIEMIGLIPGEDYNCRCTSTPVFEELEKLLENMA